MREPRELAQDIFLDKESASVAVCVDRISLMLDIDEFLELLDRMNIAKLSLINDHGIIMENFDPEVSISQKIFTIPGDEEYN